MISIEGLRVRVGLAADDDSKDETIIELEAAALAFVEQQTGRFFGTTEETTEYITATGTGELYLGSVPVDGETIEVNERAYAGGDSTTLVSADDDGYLVRGTRLLRRSGGVWTKDYEYEVTYTRGYAGDEPADLRGVVLDLVALKFTSRGSMKSESISGYSYTLADLEELPMTMVTIKSHRRIRI